MALVTEAIKAATPSMPSVGFEQESDLPDRCPGDGCTSFGRSLILLRGVSLYDSHLPHPMTTPSHVLMDIGVSTCNQAQDSYSILCDSLTLTLL